MVECLRRLAVPGTENKQRDADLDQLADLVKTQKIRDVPFTPEFYKLLFDFMKLALGWKGKDEQARIVKAETCFLGILRFPELEAGFAEEHVSESFLQCILSRTDGTGTQDEWPFVREVLLWTYSHYPGSRKTIRAGIGRTLRSFARFSHRSVPVGPLLQVLIPIIRGFQDPMTEVQKSLLMDVLLPLHSTNEWQQWDRQTALLAMYHQDLVACLTLYLERKPSLAVRCIEAVCSYFPPSREANTPKDILLLYELATFFKYLQPRDFREVLPVLTREMKRLLASQNAQPIQAVLQFWKDDHFVELSKGESSKLIPQMLPALLRGGELFWNLTVNRMTSLVLEKLEQSDPKTFLATIEELWGPGGSVPMFEIRDAAAADAAAKAAAEEEAKQSAGADGGTVPNVSSLQFCMAGWQPPKGGAQHSDVSGKKQPPLTATGVAPWAFGAGAGKPGGALGGKQQPPSTVTGVAPWAFGGSKPPKSSGPLTALAEKSAAAQQPKIAASGVERLREFTKRLCPEGSAGSEGGSAWESALTAETPTLLPKLKFHDIVFGNRDLGSGAFSVVRYARTIVKDKTQKDWPEYAVKIINTKTLEELNYEASVNREICVLRMLSHPGIARMVASFRYKDGAYLVLEYAAKGDLHTILLRQGKLDDETSKFFLGEVLAALIAIHEVGFVYADLKPENVVITSNNHAKITDFGACRPMTEEAKTRTQQSLLRHLRDGDWRAKEEDQPKEAPLDASLQVDDSRVEGTTMYLPPEVVSGKSPPTLAADAWALGCLTFQLRIGRPPIWVESDEEDDLRKSILAFRNADALSMESLSPDCCSFITSLMQVDWPNRLSLTNAVNHAFFAGLDVYTLYKRPQGPQVSAPSGNDLAPAGDARWQKRQYSKIWTTVPQVHDVAAMPQGNNAKIIPETAAESECPFGEEVATSLPLPSSSKENHFSL